MLSLAKQKNLLTFVNFGSDSAPVMTGVRNEVAKKLTDRFPYFVVLPTD